MAFRPRDRIADMIIDTSALIAILKNEPESETFSAAIEAAKVVRISTASYFESNIVISKYKDPILTARLEEILDNPEASDPAGNRIASKDRVARLPRLRQRQRPPRQPQLRRLLQLRPGPRKT